MEVLLGYVVGFLGLLIAVMAVGCWAMKGKSDGYPTLPDSYRSGQQPQDPGISENYDQMITRSYIRDIRDNTKK